VERGAALPLALGIDPRVNDLLFVPGAAGDGALYAATDGGLYAVTRDPAGRYAAARVEDPEGPPREHTSAVHRDARTGDLWVAGARTLSRLQAGRWARWRADDVPALAQLDAVTTDDAGRVWAGGLHGVVRLDPSAGSATVLRASSGALAVDWVTALAPWRGGVAVGTYNGGLSLFAADGASRIAREADGLPAGWVNPHAARAIGDDLWYGALDRGLVVGAPGRWKKLGIADGLPSADVTAILPDGPDRVWVATRGGLARLAR
jgi:ligand-binding sensor domain-containing protein